MEVISDRDAELSDSSRRNSKEEQLLLTAACSFQRQFSLLFPTRKPLMLSALNECGVQKLVCTTLRPSAPCLLPLHTWRGSASFVADFLSPEFLDPPTKLPRSLRSPSSVLQRRSASCFELATLLCSLLLGADYDAYCVSGYADREMCQLDQNQLDWTQLDGLTQDEDTTVTLSETSQQQQQQQPQCKYSVKPQRVLQSRFLLEQQKKKEQQEKKEEAQEEDQRVAPPPDPLHGLRVHCWVLVLSGSRGVTQNFFIDPLSGKEFRTDCRHFLGVESLWNHLNYYCCLTHTATGCSGLTFDLDDTSQWERLLVGAVSRNQLIQEVQRRKEEVMEEEEEELRLKVLEMPRSWIEPFSQHISHTGARTHTHALKILRLSKVSR